MDKKLKRLKKLKLLKEVAAAQKQALRLSQEQQINLVQTKIMEQELQQLKDHLSDLEERRNELLARTMALDPSLSASEEETEN